MHWSLSTTLMKLVGICLRFIFTFYQLHYQYSCFVCSFISISFSASDSLTQQLLILCRYFSRWLCLHQDYTKCFQTFLSALPSDFRSKQVFLFYLLIYFR
uniref:Uncharacterized protein n=1 Tax=Populus trichocarpa TaxID=3694 RepID=A0A2K2BI70_POPTR